MKDETTKQNVITRRSVLAMFSAGLAGAACYPFAGVAEDAEPKDPELDKWTVAFGESKAVPLLEIASGMDTVEGYECSITKKKFYSPTVARMDLTISGPASDVGMDFDSVGRQINVTVSINGEPSVVSDAMCTGIVSAYENDKPPTVCVTMIRKVNT